MLPPKVFQLLCTIWARRRPLQVRTANENYLYTEWPREFFATFESAGRRAMRVHTSAQAHLHAHAHTRAHVYI